MLGASRIGGDVRVNDPNDLNPDTAAMVMIDLMKLSSDVDDGAGLVVKGAHVRGSGQVVIQGEGEDVFLVRHGLSWRVRRLGDSFELTAWKDGDQVQQDVLPPGLITGWTVPGSGY